MLSIRKSQIAVLLFLATLNTLFAGDLISNTLKDTTTQLESLLTDQLGSIGQFVSIKCTNIPSLTNQPSLSNMCSSESASLENSFLNSFSINLGICDLSFGLDKTCAQQEASLLCENTNSYNSRLLNQSNRYLNITGGDIYDKKTTCSDSSNNLSQIKLPDNMDPFSIDTKYYKDCQGDKQCLQESLSYLPANKKDFVEIETKEVAKLNQSYLSTLGSLQTSYSLKAQVDSSCANSDTPSNCYEKIQNDYLEKTGKTNTKRLEENLAYKNATIDSATDAIFYPSFYSQKIKEKTPLYFHGNYGKITNNLMQNKIFINAEKHEESQNFKFLMILQYRNNLVFSKTFYAKEFKDYFARVSDMVSYD